MDGMLNSGDNLKGVSAWALLASMCKGLSQHIVERFSTAENLTKRL